MKLGVERVKYYKMIIPLLINVYVFTFLTDLNEIFI